MATGPETAGLLCNQLVAQRTPQPWVLVPLDFHRHVEFTIKNADVGPLAVGVLNLRLGDDSGGEFFPQVREQGVPAVLLDFGRFRTSVCSLIPILSPIVGVATADPVGKRVQLINQQSGQISGVGRSAVAEGWKQLPIW